MKIQSMISNVAYLTNELMIHRRTKSLSCPFCRTSLKHVKSRDLWVYVDYSDAVDMEILMKDNGQMLFMYIEKLPLVTTKDCYDMKEKRHL
jgi:hypothetical protein